MTNGHNHSCGIKDDGNIECWGNNNYGQATPPTGLFVQISTGMNHTCAVNINQNIECWGRNDYGETTPPAGSATVSSGNWHTCGIKNDNTIECWGASSIWSSNTSNWFICSNLCWSISYLCCKY